MMESCFIYMEIASKVLSNSQVNFVMSGCSRVGLSDPEDLHFGGNKFL